MPIQECKHSRGEVVFGIHNVKTTWMAAQQTRGIGGPTLTRHWANVSWSLTIITFYRLEVVSCYRDPRFKLAESCLV